ncbi:MAG: threonine--tRNA ligase [bacterium]|nr:threonine--tRNA ligase [bacterium]
MPEDKLHNIRHSFAHVLAVAVLKFFPEAKLGVGPVIENGCYYDFFLNRALTPDDLKNIEREMKKIIGRSLSFERQEMKSTEAKKFFEKQKQLFKIELVRDIERYGTTALEDIQRITHEDRLTKETTVSLYKTGGFIDLCRGGHVENTKELNPDAFKVDKTSGAYWRGSVEREQMQRIYILAFEKKEELGAFLAQRIEAEKRDHKKLGPQLDLFVFSDLVGAGLPLFTPKGTLIREKLEEFVQSLQEPLGYQRVRIPHITKRDLYVTSGHWEKFKDELFKITTREKHEFAMKPMNCPHHTQIYAAKKRSYRELPIRYSEVTSVYRDEQSGELAGLSRVRVITQDDAHVFCRISQVEKEAFKIWDIIDKFYKPFKMPLTVRFSRHDPAHMEKYLGTQEIWKRAEDQLLTLIKKRRIKYVDGLGEAAMYGPKIDFIAKDSLGREWQLATIQLDFNLPERFDLTCINEKGESERIVMIHRAILGSLERFMAILIEHYAGAFPLWLAPVQVAILPIGKGHKAYAKQIEKTLDHENIRTLLREDDETIGKKIRESEIQKIPYLLIVGDKERSKKTVAVRVRGRGDIGAEKLEKFLKKIKEEINRKK